MFTVTSLTTQPTTESKGYELPPLMAMLARRIRLIVTVFLGVFLIMIAATLITPRMYTTTVTVIAGNPGGTTAPSGSSAIVSSLPILNALVMANGTQTPETYAALFQQTPVAQTVIDQLHLNITPTALLAHVSVVPVTNTSLLNLSVTWPNRDMSASIANAFATAVSERERQLITDQANSAIGFLSHEMPVARQQVQQTASALAQYQSSHHLADMTAQTSTVLATLASIDTQQNQEQLAAREAQAQLTTTQAQLRAIPPTITGSAALTENPGLAGLQTQLASVEVQLQDALHKYTNQHPVVIALRQQEADLKRGIAAQGGPNLSGSTVIPNPLYQQLQQQSAVESTALQSSNAAFAELARQRKALQPALASLPAEAARYGELDRASKSAQAVYSAVEQKYNEANIARTTALSDVTVTQPAVAEMAVVQPRLFLSGIISLIIALALALGVAAVAELFDNRIKDESHAERALGLPVLSSIPLVIGEGESIEELRSASGKSFLRLASSVHFAPHRISAIAITSNEAREGRSTVALNLALAFAELGERVLLVDATRQTLPSGDEGAGLYDILLGRSTLSDAVRPSRSALVDILPPGDSRSNVISALGGTAVRGLIAHARETYGYVVFDTPALHDNIEASLLLRSVESTIFVVKQGATDVSWARQTLDNVRGMRISTIVGMIVNGAKIDLHDRAIPAPKEPEKIQLPAAS